MSSSAIFRGLLEIKSFYAFHYFSPLIIYMIEVFILKMYKLFVFEFQNIIYLVKMLTVFFFMNDYKFQ